MVTRIQIADTVGDAFDHLPVTRSGLLSIAASVHAHPRLLETLERLPDRDYGQLRDLWSHLDDVPIES